MSVGVRAKLQEAIRDGPFEAIFVMGPDNVQYVAELSLPFLYNEHERHMAVFWPRQGQAVCVCPCEWESTIIDAGWIGGMEVYGSPTDTWSAPQILAKLASPIVAAGSSIGVDARRVAHEKFLHLQASLPEHQLVSCDDWLDEQRMHKTPEELELLSDIALRTDHGILGAVHHLSVKDVHSEKRLAEEIRVHCQERLLETVGHHSVSLVASGERIQKFWPLAPRFGLGWDEVPQLGQMVRLEMRAMLKGYWSDAARMMAMGKPDERQSEVYQSLVSLRETAVECMNPGIRCNEVYRRVLQEAGRLGVLLIEGLSLGHGIGISTFERPYISAIDQTVLRVGMALVLDLILLGPEEALVRSKDTVLITETGARTVGWYKDWREPYIAAYTF